MSEVKLESNEIPELIGVLFPGIVKNDEKALQCLGGIKNISQAYSLSNKKLSLSYQPENPFIKKIYGDMRKTAGLLLKVKIKKIRSGTEVKREVISTMIVGAVNKIYKFESMCDFQYLPLQTNVKGTTQCISEQILPTDLGDFDFIKKPAPLYIVPSYFTRAEKPYSYAYTEKKNAEKAEELDKEKDVLFNGRKSRCMPHNQYKFGLTNDLPTEPQEYLVKRKNQRMALFPQLEQELQTISKMFDERPIWSAKLILYHTKFKAISLKIILPCLAVYMNDGPWKTMWVKFGYDPRKFPEARMYQALDVRVRHSGGMNFMVKTREQYSVSKKSRERRSDNFSADDSMTSEDIIEEGAVVFRPGIVPTQRQIYYQYCDIHLPEIQEILAKEPPPGYLCHQTHGWLPPKTDQFCRDSIFKYLKQAIFSTNTNEDLKLEQGSSEDELGSNSDDGEYADGPSTSTTGD